MRNDRIGAVLTATAALLLTPSFLGAQGARPGPLATAANVRCKFSLMAISSLRDEPPKAELKPSTMVLEFEGINADEGTARLKSGYGDYDIIVRYAQGYLNLIQSFRDGPLHVTTILEQTTKGGKLKAMHSKHEYMAFALTGYTSSPEQYYGECEIVNETPR